MTTLKQAESPDEFRDVLTDAQQGLFEIRALACGAIALLLKPDDAGLGEYRHEAALTIMEKLLESSKSSLGALDKLI